MSLRNGFLLLLVLVISSTYVDARSLVSYDILVMPTDYKVSKSGKGIPETVERDEQLCTLCEKFTAQATNYLGENKTETEIIDTLHEACSRLHSLEQQCVMLVDYYAPLFFTEIGKIRPEEFCRKVDLCEERSLFLPKREDTCTLCHQVVVEVLTKLKDPDAQLEIIQMLLKECNKVEHYVQQCKRLVFQFGPLILINGEKFLETTDVCTSIHACKANQEDVGQAFLAGELVPDA